MATSAETVLWRPIDIAEHFGISRQRVNGWTKRPDFPAPEPNYPTRVWRRHEVLAFVDQHHPELLEEPRGR